MGLIANQLSSATALIRRSVFETVRYDERLPSYEDWDLYLRLAQSGHRFLVTNDVQFFYRQRKGSMISGVDRARHYLLLSRLLGNLAASSTPRDAPLRAFSSRRPRESAVAAGRGATGWRMPSTKS